MNKLINLYISTLFVEKIYARLCTWNEGEVFKDE